MTSIPTRARGFGLQTPDLPRPDVGQPIAVFRHALRSLPAAPSRADLQALLEMAGSLHLPESQVQEELAEIRASLEALDFAEQVAATGLPVLADVEPRPDGDPCHFVTPIRFGRRRSDQFGNLELTGSWLKFRGALDLSVVWSEVASVQRTGHDVVVALVDSRRVLRFCCHAAGEAARAAVIAAHLMNAARREE